MFSSVLVCFLFFICCFIMQWLSFSWGSCSIPLKACSGESRGKFAESLWKSKQTTSTELILSVCSLISSNNSNIYEWQRSCWLFKGNQIYWSVNEFCSSLHFLLICLVQISYLQVCSFSHFPWNLSRNVGLAFSIWYLIITLWISREF